MPTLYVVATPIGNLGDMSPRAIETLRAVQLIAAEDTRVTMKLLNAFDISTPLTSCHEHNERSKAVQIAERMLAENIDVAVTTDAGTPCISDPGSVLVREAVERGIPVVAVSGPTAIAPPPFVTVVPVVSAQDMFEAVAANAPESDFIFKAAAVADYTPANYSDNKVKKSEGDMSIPLKRTRDILKYLGENRVPGQVICGFSMETQNMVENSREKLVKKNVDMICANNLKQSGAGFGVDTNVITIITRSEITELPLQSKESAANAILDAAVRLAP